MKKSLRTPNLTLWDRVTAVADSECAIFDDPIIEKPYGNVDKHNCYSEKELSEQLQGTAQMIDSRKGLRIELLPGMNIKDYERLVDSSVAFTKLSIIRLTVNKFIL